ncbi:centrosomal protein of 57 kDa-like [Clavelina lepadiformis]|uniref:centrosomal protein of 57 kDa-like n=1 Tax=Clavelina lepadiformis TaxID=159417 RepID=UPI0040437EFA
MTSLFDDPSIIASYQEYPTRRPFLNSEMTRTPDKKINACPESSSQAVLSALKGLQDKIHNLEMDRSKAERNLKSLAAETSLYKDMLKDTKRMSPAANKPPRTNQMRVTTLQPPPASRQPVTSQRGSAVRKEAEENSVEVESQLRNADTRCRLLERQLENMRRMVQQAERERSDALERQVALERERGRMTAENMDAYAKLNKLEEIHDRFDDLLSRKEKSEQKVKELEEKLKMEIHQKKLLSDQTAQIQSQAQANQILMKHEAKKPPKPKRKTLKKKKRQATTTTNKAVSAPSKPPLSKQNIAGQPHYRVNLADIPFVTGTSTSPSHAVSANVQKLLHRLKHHSPLYCNDQVVCDEIQSSDNNSGDDEPTVNQNKIKLKPASRKLSSTEEDLSDLLVALQDEFGRMTFEHQALAKQMANTSDDEVSMDLQCELDALVQKMDKKGEQIATVRRHRAQLDKSRRNKLKQSNSKAASATVNGRSSSVPCTTRKGRIAGRPASATTSPRQSPGDLRQKRIAFLRDMRTVRSALKENDLSWD